MKTRRPILAYLLLIVVTLVTLFPIYWMVKTSIIPEGAVYRNPPSLGFKWSEVSFQRYPRIWDESLAMNWILNTAFIAVVSSLLAILVAVPAAYALSRYRYRFASVAGYVLLTTRMMPLTLLIIPMYTVFGKMGLLDNLASVIIANLAYILPFAIWILKEFFDSLPPELDEAAGIDGCSVLGILRHILLPLSLPGIGATVIYSFVRVWGEFLFANTFINSPEKMTVTVGAQLYAGSLHVSWGDIMTVTTMGILPIVILFLFMEKYFVSGLSAGAVKS